MKKMLIIFLWLSQQVNSQELGFTGGTGFAFATTNYLKKIVYYSDLTCNFESPIRADLFFYAGLGGSSLKFSYSDTGNINVFSRRYSIYIPVGVKKHYIINSKARLFLALGPAFNYYLIQKRNLKNYSLHKTETNKNLGFSLGSFLSFGYKRILNKQAAFEIGFASQETLHTNFRNESDKVKFRSNSINIGLLFNVAKP